MASNKDKSLITYAVSVVFDFLKQVVKDFEHSRSVRKIDKFAEHFSTLEHLVLRLESKLEENRRQIEALKTKVFTLQIVQIVLLAIILVKIFIY